MRAGKSDLRRHVLAKRDLVSTMEARWAAATIASLGLTLVQNYCRPGAVVAAYWPIRSEIGTRPLFDALDTAGFVTALPVVQGSSRPLEFRRWSPDDDLERGAFGISHPPASATTVIPTFVFVPLAAFDLRGGRVGYGGGHYDATLPRLRDKGALVAAGLAYAIQEVETIPLEDHDQLLDFVITEERTITCGAG